jgi:Uma2 family endonuclease
MSTMARRRSGDRLVLYGIPWESYVRVLRAFQDRRLRITYDRGALEIMTVSPKHERHKHLLRRLVEALLEELGWNVAGYGSMTFKRRKKERGLEPDECYWIQNEPRVRHKLRFNWKLDPPPDLVLEIEVSRSALNRISIYQALGVPEVWRQRGNSIRVMVLGGDGKYLQSPSSRAFPFVPMSELERFLGMSKLTPETELIRQFRAWVRERIAAEWKS